MLTDPEADHAQGLPFEDRDRVLARHVSLSVKATAADLGNGHSPIHGQSQPHHIDIGLRLRQRVLRLAGRWLAARQILFYCLGVPVVPLLHRLADVRLPSVSSSSVATEVRGSGGSLGPKKVRTVGPDRVALSRQRLRPQPGLDRCRIWLFSLATTLPKRSSVTANDHRIGPVGVDLKSLHALPCLGKVVPISSASST